MTDKQNLADKIKRLDAVVPKRFYVDCEFDGHNGPLLSIALVKDDGDGIHIQADIEAMDLWVRRNIMPLMEAHKAPKSAKVYLDEIGGVIRAFIGQCACPVIVADSPVDIGRFCRAISTGHDGDWFSTAYPEMRFEVHNIDCYPTDLVGAVQHNAWWDAMALRHRLTAPRAAQLPADVAGLVRYGIAWQGENKPICAPMPDGYWTPWHVADAALTARIASARAEGRREGIEEARDCQPSTAENPNEDAYQRGRFDGIMEYAKAIGALAEKQP